MSKPPPEKLAVLAIVSPPANGEAEKMVPLYLKDLKPKSSTEVAASTSQQPSSMHLHHFILCASLDMVEERQWTTGQPFLGIVDVFRDVCVSAWMTPSGTRLLLLHSQTYSEGNVKQFLRGVHLLWAKMALSPLRKRDAPVHSASFDARVAQLVTRFLA